MVNMQWIKRSVWSILGVLAGAARAPAAAVDAEPGGVQIEVSSASVRLTRGGLEFQWRRGVGDRVRYHQLPVLVPYADEFTVHDPAWKQTFYSSRRSTAVAKLSGADSQPPGHAAVIADANAHFRWRKRVDMPDPATLRLAYEYSIEDRTDARLQLGFRPAPAWLSGAQYRVTVQGKVETGRLGTEYSGRRILWSGITEAEFTKVPFGSCIVRSTEPMTLYDVRKQNQFWLGWDLALEKGRTYHATMTIAFKPFTADIAGVRIRNVEWTREVRDGVFRVGMELAAGSPGAPRSLRARLRLRERSAGGAVDSAAPVVRTILLGPEPRRAEFTLAVAERGHYSAELRLSRPEDRQALVELTPLDFDVYPFFEFFSTYSLYMDEPSVAFTVRLRPGAPSPDQLILRLADEEGKGVGGEYPLGGGRREVLVPRSVFPDGFHTVTAKVFRNGRLAAKARTRFSTAPPKPWAVRIDRRTRGLVVDGKPFFPFGFYVHKGRFYDDPLGPEYVLDLEAPHKFNLVCPYHNFDLGFRREKRPTIERFLDRADAVGLKMHYDIRKLCCAKPTSEIEAAILDEVRHYRSFPAVLCWYLADEPAGQRIPAERFLGMYPRIRRTDPYHPTTMVFCIPAKAPEYLEALDIVMVDPYPIPNQPVTRVAQTLDSVRAALPPGMPLWCVPQAFGGGEGWGREPTPEEERCMTYLAILHGATGIQYFIRRPPMNNPFTGALWGEIRRMASEIRELTPLLLSPSPRPEVRVTAPAVGVEAAAYRRSRQVLILVVNTRNAPTSFSVRGTGISPAVDRAQVLFRNRSIPIGADAEIRDWLDGFGVRLYTFDIRGADMGARTPQQTAVQTGNLLHNGDFEKQANVGYPDYFRYGQGSDLAASWGTDALEAHSGRHALFIRNPGQGGHAPSVTSFPMLLGAGRYRLSLFARGDRGGLPLRVTVSGGLKKVDRLFTVTGDWQEVSVEFAGPPKRRRMHVGFSPQERGVVWIDAARVAALGK